VRDDFVQVAFKKDYSTDYDGGMRQFGSRSTRHDMDALVTEFFASSVLGGDNKVECDRCMKRTEHVQHKVLIKSPEILIATVKRFSYDWRRNKATKSLMGVHFKPFIILPSSAARPSDVQDRATRKEMMKPRCYGLFAVVVHAGATINSGHYYCYARSTDTKAQLDLKDAPNSPWMKLNDSRITVVEGGFNKMRSDIRESVSATAYMLLYQRLDKGPEMLRQQSTFPKNPDTVSHPVAEEAVGVGATESSACGTKDKADCKKFADEDEDDSEDEDDDESMLAAALALSAAVSSSSDNAGQVKEVEEDEEDDLAAALAMSTVRKLEKDTANDDISDQPGKSDDIQNAALAMPASPENIHGRAVPVSSSVTNMAQLRDELDDFEQREREDAAHVRNFRLRMDSFIANNSSYLTETVAGQTSTRWLGILRDLSWIEYQESAQKHNESGAGNTGYLWEFSEPMSRQSGRVQLRALGFCGADDSVNPKELWEISRTFPGIEWGVLFRPDKEGTPRYASSEWVFNDLARAFRGAAGEGLKLNLAAHLCGARVVEVLNGDAAFVKKLRDEVGFRRFQVNATAANGVDTSRLPDFVSGLRASMEAVPNVEWIVQRNEETRPLWEGLVSGRAGVDSGNRPAQTPGNMSVLFDASMGLGVSIQEFPDPPKPDEVPRGCGYAGGIGPRNIRGVLMAVAEATQCVVPTWIDMESSLRTMRASGVDVFDLDKCRACVAKAMSLVTVVGTNIA
jgi:hypothetical protein